MPVTQNLHDDISAIQGYLKKYAPDLISQFLNTLEIFNNPNIRVIRNLRTEMDLNKMTVEDGVRPLNTSIENAKGKRIWTKRKLTPHYGMKIFEMKIQDLRKTFMSEQLAPNADQIPFAAWVWMQEFKKLAQEINDNLYLAKHHNEPAEWDNATAYAIGDLVYYKEIIYEALAITAAGESPESAGAKWTDVDNKVLFDGPGTVLANELAASNGFDAIVTGSYDDTTAYEAYKTQWGNIPEAQKKNGGMIAWASHASVEDLVTNVNKEFGSGKGIGGVDVQEGEGFYLKNTNRRLWVQPVTWMNESRRIMMTKPQNLVFGTDQVSDMEAVGNMVKTLHGFKAITNFQLTFNFADLEALHVNDQQ